MNQSKTGSKRLDGWFTDPYTNALIAMGLGLWVWSAVHPIDFATWAIEQIATLIGVGTVLWLARRMTFDRTAQLALFALFCLHSIGTHYTYSLTPYHQWSIHLFGSSPNDWFGWERNHYDRLVHFAYGLLMAHPIEQALQQYLQLSRGVRKFFSLNLILSSSALYELAEWAAAVNVGGDVGTAYLGSQGDIWDAQIDIALAGLGWLAAYCASLVRSNRR